MGKSLCWLPWPPPAWIVSEEQGTRNEEQGTRRKEEGTRRKEEEERQIRRKTMKNTQTDEGNKYIYEPPYPSTRLLLECLSFLSIFSRSHVLHPHLSIYPALSLSPSPSLPLSLSPHHLGSIVCKRYHHRYEEVCRVRRDWYEEGRRY